MPRSLPPSLPLSPPPGSRQPTTLALRFFCTRVLCTLCHRSNPLYLLGDLSTFLFGFVFGIRLCSSRTPHTSHQI
ncbi:hypothetical protein MPTK1_5g05870 [Marchantia polymorpha subsp. ruderalis]|uniref:Uncharacterized protein n=2 Tax=Marchantia polymorpha TaxID=3197 RepID=A0AAF6BFE2_MARPO|nr:hypothetical protein MARPO_0027s0040 [Marchantia polymorpha]BBN10726.1 hypothetical protein Mp_5g05870 [Marchantia polymorpha subsp. ruderalis]|eukprot:PTQ42908.1 hypothetical protein MARPO_0027s0040 [Marchantia polymorpha]